MWLYWGGTNTDVYLSLPSEKLRGFCCVSPQIIDIIGIDLDPTRVQTCTGLGSKTWLDGMSFSLGMQRVARLLNSCLNPC